MYGWSQYVNRFFSKLVLIPKIVFSFCASPSSFCSPFLLLLLQVNVNMRAASFKAVSPTALQVHPERLEYLSNYSFVNKLLH